MIRKFIVESVNPGRICYNSFRDKVSDLIDQLFYEENTQFIDDFNSDFLKSKFNTGFTEEIKDSRSSKVSINYIIRKLNKSTIKCIGAEIYINDIKFLKSEDQQSDSSSIYRMYWFELNIIFKYD